MERLKSRDTLVVKKRDIWASTALAGAMIIGQAAFSSEAHNEYEYMPIPRESFMPIPRESFMPINLPSESSKILPYSGEIIEFPTPSPTIIPEKPLSKTELKINHYRSESRKILNLATNSGKFSKNQLRDWKIYGPIYIAAGEATKVDPLNLWVTHEAESGASAENSKAFDKDSHYIGGMQLSPLIFNAYKDKPLVKKLGNLLKSEFKVRHKGDIENIIIASLYIGANEDTIKNSKIRSEQKGFIRFVGSESAGISRYENAKKRKSILERQEKKEAA